VRAEMGIMKWVLREIMRCAHGGPRCRGREFLRWIYIHACWIGNRPIDQAPHGENPVEPSRLSTPPAWRYVGQLAGSF